MSGIPPNSLFSVFAFIGFLLAGLPLPWHIQSWNMGSCMYMLWTSLGCLMLFVNSIVWNDNVVNWAPVWCDISSHYIIGASVGIPASSLCIIRRLYYITKLQTISVEREQRRREIMVDLSIGIGFPCIVMALEYIVQGRRFGIIEQIGCYPLTVNTLAAYFLGFIWPLLIGLVSLVYAVLTFRRAFLQKEQLKQMLRAGFSISAGRYWRLMALCSTEIIFTVPMSLYVIIANAVAQPVPYVSWAWIHSDFSQVDQLPTVIWQSVPDMATAVETTRWLYILCAFLIFAFFGWAQEVRDSYRQAFSFVCRRIGYSTVVSKWFACARKLSLPVHDVDQQNRSDHLSMPIQARARRHSFGASLSFEAPSRTETLSSTFRLSVDNRLTENPLNPSSSLGGLARHTHISSASMPAAPDPALARDRRSRISNQDVGQLV